ncbi:MAG: hypothetical protein KC996_02030 [Phycisphaerales bacterium]|nr:hypothetical protein [Phycisphaerales bacterium]
MAIMPDSFCSAARLHLVAGALLCASAPAFGGSIHDERAYAAELRNESFQDSMWSPDQVRTDNSSMRMSALVQTRYMASLRKNETGSPAFEATTVGFDLPRTQLTLEGTIVNSQLTYKLTMDSGDAELGRGRGSSPPVAGNTGTPVLLDAYAQYNFGGKREGYYLKAGQFKHVMHTEEAVEAQYQLAVERSLTNEFFTLGYTQGVALGRVERDWAWEISISDGGRYLSSREVANSSFNNPFEADIAIAGRLDWKLQGGWEQFVDFTSFQGTQDALKIGAGMFWMLGGDTNPGGYVPPLLVPQLIREEIFAWTVDVQYEGDGWNFFAAVMGNYIDWQFVANQSLYVSNYGVVVQGGVFVDDKSELFARVDGIWYDGVLSSGFGVSQGEPSTILTLGWNYYVIPESHAAKFTADVGWASTNNFGLSAGFGSSATLPDPSVTGFIGSTGTEYVFRAQFQILF